jgi:cyclophilin family peptidyl-prolyl cis-trans isomerase
LATEIAALSPPSPDDPAWRTRAQGAIDRGRAFTARFPTDPRGLEVQATLAIELEDDEAVDASMRALLALAPSKTAAGLAWARYWQTRDTTRARAVLEELVAGRPDALQYIQHLMTTLLAEGPGAVRTRFDTLARSDETFSQAVRELDILARVHGPAAAAIGESLRASRPDDLELLIATARGYRHANQFAAARRLMNSVPEALLTDPAHVYLWSDVHYADHEFDRARELLDSIDMDALEASGRPGLHRRLRFMIPLRQTAADGWPAESERRASDASRGDNPLATLIVEGREVTVELFEDDAPNTVAAFVAAADRGHFDGHPAGLVHRGFRTIFGDRREDDGMPPWTIPDEHELPQARPILAGSLVAYRTSRLDSADTTFFVMHFPGPHLNNKRTTFGRVLTGLDVIREMEQGDVLDSVVVTRRRPHPYDPIVLDTAGNRLPLSELTDRPAAAPDGVTEDPPPPADGTPS